MLDANELVEEYMERYVCSKEEAIKMVLEDLRRTQTALVVMKYEKQGDS